LRPISLEAPLRPPFCISTKLYRLGRRKGGCFRGRFCFAEDPSKRMLSTTVNLIPLESGGACPGLNGGREKNTESGPDRIFLRGDKSSPN
ncbi:hypothetical protein AVEN_118947-1, partial [Araneus ventricosus]